MDNQEDQWDTDLCITEDQVQWDQHLPGRVFPGKKLPGHMGCLTVTIQNLEVVKVDLDKNVILVKGSVPGAKGSILKIKSN